MDAREAVRDAIAAIRGPDERARDAARGLQLGLTKPAGALGRLEEIAVWAAGVYRDPAPAYGPACVVVAAADHGVARSGVSAYPADVTAQMVRNFLAGGAAINVLARRAGADVRVVDAGVATDIADPALAVVKRRRGNDDLGAGAAMSPDEAEELVANGVRFAQGLAAAGTRIVALGDMGIGNTTAAAALTSAFTGTPPRHTVGRGTGVDDRGYARKLEAVEAAVARCRGRDALSVLAKAGGFEIAFLAGVAIGCASASVAVVLDGYPTTAAALVASALAPAATAYMLAAHLSVEPGHGVALDHLGLRPLLALDMRLGEGTGAALALMLIDAALRIPREMATFEAAGVSRADAEVRAEA